MKQLIVTSLIVMMIAGIALALESVDGQKLNGKHFTLNIIGVQNPKTADMDSGGGGVIFVNLNGKSKIGLICSSDVEGLADDEFAVLDKNGTDGDGALFALPDPDLDPYVIGGDMTNPDGTPVDTMSAYSIYVRPLGKPFGSAIITTCADFVESGLETFLSAQEIKVLNRVGAFGGVCSIEQVGTDVTFRNKGKTSFTNVTAELTTIVLAVEIYEWDAVDEVYVYVDTVYVRIPIFDDLLENEYWEYDNDGLKLLQVRIYPWGTDVSEGDGDLPELPEGPVPAPWPPLD